MTETNGYVSGGVDFGDIGSHISVVGTIDPKIEETITSAMHIPFVNIDNDYYLGDCLYAVEPSTQGDALNWLARNWVMSTLSLFIVVLVVGGYIGIRRKSGAIRRIWLRLKMPRKL